MKRRKLPLHQWDPFLLAAVLGLSIVAGVVQRLGLPVVSPLVVIAGLLLAIAAAVCLGLLHFSKRFRRDPEGSLPAGFPVGLASGPAVVDPTMPTGLAGTKYAVLDGSRYQGSIDVALARGGPEFDAVLVPRATAWMGRDLRVAVDILVAGRVYRAGFLPRDCDQAVDAALAAPAASGRFAPVRVTVATSKRPHAVTLTVPAALPEASTRRT